MIRANPRLERYVSVASLPTLVAFGGSVAVVDDGFAEIVYEEVSISLQTGSGTGVSTQLQVGDFGTFDIRAIANDATAYRSFGIGNSSSDKVRIITDEPKKKSGPLPNLSRYAAGDMISVGTGKGGGNGFFSPNGLGSFHFGSATYGGNFAIDGDGPQSGYVGWGYASPLGVGYGWISLTWDGSLLEIHGYAYETEIGTAIEAGVIPAPGALGLLSLAAGAAGLRRKRQA